MSILPDETLKEIVKQLLVPALNYFAQANERKTTKGIGKLQFWDDGMRPQLEAISKGKATPKIYAQLRENFDESRSDVTKAMNRLRKARDRLGGGPVANQIDEVLNSEKYGKGPLRTDIENLLAGKFSVDAKTDAKLICYKVGMLRKELDRLHRLVKPTEEAEDKDK